VGSGRNSGGLKGIVDSRYDSGGLRGIVASRRDSSRVRGGIEAFRHIYTIARFLGGILGSNCYKAFRLALDLSCIV
jgi:hypothetical protein